MSGPFMFAASSVSLSARAAKRRDQIARKIGGKGCGYVPPAGNNQGYGYAPNAGAPFDREMAKAIEAAWKAAGV